MINFRKAKQILGRKQAIRLFNTQVTFPKCGETVWLHSGGDASREKVRAITFGKDDIFIEIERARLTPEGERYSKENNISYNSHSDYSYEELLKEFPEELIEYISISAEYFSKPSNYWSECRFGRITKDSVLIFLGMEDEEDD